jgi:hypothetical protein
MRLKKNKSRIKCSRGTSVCKEERLLYKSLQSSIADLQQDGRVTKIRDYDI